MSHNLRDWRVSIAIAAIIALGLLYWITRSPQDASAGQASQQAAPVHVEAARRAPLDVQIKALGTITPLATVSVRSRLDGELIRVLFTEGQHVTQGQLLAEIDPRPFRASLAQAVGERQQSNA